MIQRFYITCTDGNGNVLKETIIINNSRLLFKNNGSIGEQTGNLLQHLTAMPGSYGIELRVSGEHKECEKLFLLLNELPFEKNILSPLPSLTQREVQILDMLNEGKNEKQISVIFSVSYQTIRNHCCDMHHKFHCKTNGEMIAASRRLGLL